MHCSRCSLPISPDDNFCRKCGTAVTVIDVPAVRREAVPARVWRAAPPALARGVALVAAGAMLRFALGQTARLLSSRSLADGDGGRKILPFSGGRSFARSGDEVEILWYRRVRR
jgi:hypothetical protein